MITNRIYVADLAEYNNGTMKGIWIDLPCDDIHATVKEMLGSNEEWAIHDYELPFKISEYEDLDSLNEITEKLVTLDDTDTAKIEFLMWNGETIERSLELYEDVEMYESTTLEDLAEMMIDEGLFGEIPDLISNYIDYEKLGRDLSVDYIEHNGNLFRGDY